MFHSGFTQQEIDEVKGSRFFRAADFDLGRHIVVDFSHGNTLREKER